MSNLKTTSTRLDAFHFVCLGLLVLYAAFILARSSATAGGADSAGYLISAKLLTEGKLTTPPRTIPELPMDEPWDYTPLGMVPGRDGELRPTYPIGLPIHFALASRIAGWNWGPRLVNALAAIALIILTYGCARIVGAGRLWGAVGAATMALSPILVFAAMQPMSDTLAATWNTAAFYCALRARRSNRWSIACGAAVAVSVLVRPTDALIIPALCLVLWHWKNLLGAFLGGLPGALFLGWYNHTLYGSASTTGYGNIFAMISPEWLMPSLSLYGVWLPQVIPVGLLALLATPWLPWQAAWREISALLLWFFGITGFFAFYSCTHEVWWYLRFVLPAFPALAILAAVGGEVMTSRPSLRIVAAAVAVTVTLGFSHSILKRFGVYNMAEGERHYATLAVWARENLPADAVVATLYSSCSFYFYTEFPVIRSDGIKRDRYLPMVERLRASGRPLYGLFNKHDDEPRRSELMPGDWEEVKRSGDFAIWRLRLEP